MGAAPSRDYEVFELGDIALQSGESLPGAFLGYKTYGTLSTAKDNVVVLPTFYTGTHIRNEGYIGVDRALTPERYFIVSINMFGNGVSSSPSNTLPPFDGPRFPKVTLYDNVQCQHRLLTEVFGIDEIAMVTGWSMAGCQSYQWAAQYPDSVHNIMPFCASAKTSIHNFVFLEGVKATLQADGDFMNGHYTSPPERGLRAFGRVYAGWAFSQTFYRERLYKQLGFESVEELLLDWEKDHLSWDANDLLAKLWTWQQGDISANDIYENNFILALQSIKACVIVVPCSTDLYFPPEDNLFEARHIPNAECRTYDSPWGHCIATPGRDPGFMNFIDSNLRELLER